MESTAREACPKTTATKKTTSKNTTEKKTAAKKTTAKKTTAKKTTAKKTTAKKTTAKKTGAKNSTAAPPSTTPLRVGAPAPEFRLAGDDGKTHSLAEHRGKPVVLYFYPKNDTPGCTVQACDFRDKLARVEEFGAVLYGVSRDSLASHGKFRNKYSLNFPLLSDDGLVAHRAYGAWGQKNMYGKMVEGTIRSTFLIDKSGNLAAVWPKVRVEGHVDEVVRALAGLR